MITHLNVIGVGAVVCSSAMYIQIFLTLLGFFTIISSNCDVETDSRNGTFNYFAYGSNLLAKRIHILNPSAVFVAAVKLSNYRLDFITIPDPVPWNGAVATIVEDDKSEVWGSLWTLDNNQICKLNGQEYPYYYAKNVTVTTPNGTQVLARTYIGNTTPKALDKGQYLPLERRPSNTYLQVMVLGAIESHLPAEHIGFILSFPTNGRMAPDERRNQLGYPF